MSDPLQLFPKEVWKVILDFVNDPKDITSCYQTCHLFRSHFSATWAVPFIFPSLLQYLPRSDVLKCRLVSKNWQNGIDEFLQSDLFAPHLVQQLRSHKNNRHSSFMTRIPNEHFTEARNVAPENQAQRLAVARSNQVEFADRFIPVHPVHLIPRMLVSHKLDFQKFKSSFENKPEKNPFPSRAVVLTVNDATLHGTCQLLIKFGGHIWSLKLILRMSAMGGYQDVAVICNILKRVPNLKHLLIEEISRSSNEDQASTSFLKTTAAPVLAKLKWLELNIEFPSIEDFLVKSYSGRSVTIFRRMGCIDTDDLSNDWKHLTWQLNKQATNNKWKDHIQAFENLNLPLETINLQYSVCEDFKSIFDILSKYGQTMRQITLIYKDFKIRELIEMRNQVDLIYNGFLSQMKSLENFIMILDCADSECNNEFRQFAEQILKADWIEMHSNMDEVMSGFTTYGLLCIFAGLKTKANGTMELKRK